jgi:pilus assembly protein CpaB
MAAKRYSFVFYIAILVAVAATYSVFKVLESTKASSRVATVPVVIAARDINEGVPIDRIAVTVAQWPVSTVPVGAYGRVDSVAGRVSRVPIFNGEPIVPGRLAPEGTEPGLTSKITPGKRAKSIRINDVSGIAGLIQPNARVDLVLNTMLSNATRTGKIFMQNMRVLAMQTATDKTADGRPIPASVATLEVTPEELELLTIALATGSIELALRGYGDPDSVRTSGATTADLERAMREGGLRSAPAPRVTTSNRGSSRPPAPRVVPETVVIRQPAEVQRAPAKPDSNKVEIFKGSAKTELKFGKDSARRDTIPNN